jgi:hypothetical protein
MKAPAIPLVEPHAEMAPHATLAAHVIKQAIVDLSDLSPSVRASASAFLAGSDSLEPDIIRARTRLLLARFRAAPGVRLRDIA